MSKVADLGGLSLEQKRELAAKLLRQKARSRRDVPSLAHRRIEIQAAQTPKAVALTCTDGSLTYSELNSRANRLARHLRKIGVGPEVLVGLCVSRSTDMVVGLLAILKAGGAYVPLDPAYPAERLAFMIDDARVPVLLTEEKLRGDLPVCQARVVCLDSGRAVIDAQSAANLEVELAESNLAYVIFTSGSTGKPKGVQVTHGAIANLLESMRKLLSITERDALLAVTTLSFDIAALEIFLPLIAGAAWSRSTAPLPRMPTNLPDAWTIRRSPSCRRRQPRGVYCWKEGGAASRRSQCSAAVRPCLRSGRSVGGQGTCALERLRSNRDDRLVVGLAGRGRRRPDFDRQSDRQHATLRSRQAAAGRSRGHRRRALYRRRGLARGYRHRPGLTAERFIPDPFGSSRGARLYRTGDLARWRHDGGLECLGRVDQQVKVRGFRIELGEIEAALARHPAVRQAAVSARPDPSGELSLAAYIVPRDRIHTGLAAELRQWLRGAVPDYMVPGAFVLLDAIPLTPNGKVDRQALPDPGRAQSSAGAAFVPPSGPIEEVLAELWRELLGAQRVGAHDNFFERGGHSLLAVQLLSRLHQIFAVEWSLRDFLEDPTITRLARIIKQALETGTDGSATPLVPVERGVPLPASFAQQRLWFLDQLQPGLASYHISAAVKLVGRLDMIALERAFNEVVRRHEILRTTLKADGGVPLQVIAERLVLPLTIEDLSGHLDDEREFQAENRIHTETEQPFDLGAVRFFVPVC